MYRRTKKGNILTPKISVLYFTFFLDNVRDSSNKTNSIIIVFINVNNEYPTFKNTETATATNVYAISQSINPTTMTTLLTWNLFLHNCTML